MKSQLFKKKYDKDKLLDLLKKYCEITNQKHLILSKSAYKKMQLDNACQPFFDELGEYYHNSKKFYVCRKIIYKNFATVIKQLCKLHIIPYTSRIKYSHSNYEIFYCIYY